MVSLESTDGTNWLFMKRPVGTEIVFVVPGTGNCGVVAITADVDEVLDRAREG